MTAQDFKNALNRLDLNDYNEAGFIFRVSWQTIYKWANGKKPVPAMVGRLVQIIELTGILDILMDEYRLIQEVEVVR